MIFWNSIGSASDNGPSGLHQIMANGFMVGTHVRGKDGPARQEARDTVAKSAFFFFLNKSSLFLEPIVA